METPREILKKSTVHTLNINEGSPLQEAVISAMKEYAESKIVQLKADKAELLEALERCNNELHFYSGHTDFVKEKESLIQKHKK